MADREDLKELDDALMCLHEQLVEWDYLASEPAPVGHLMQTVYQLVEAATYAMEAARCIHNRMTTPIDGNIPMVYPYAEHEIRSRIEEAQKALKRAKIKL
jgi:hypothetical protein